LRRVQQEQPAQQQQLLQMLLPDPSFWASISAA
jgi:hypothetical protein